MSLVPLLSAKAASKLERLDHENHCACLRLLKKKKKINEVNTDLKGLNEI